MFILNIIIIRYGRHLGGMGAEGLPCFTHCPDESLIQVSSGVRKRMMAITTRAAAMTIAKIHSFNFIVSLTLRKSAYRLPSLFRRQFTRNNTPVSASGPEMIK